MGASKKPSRPTIHDLERYCGYTKSTISRAFNPRASVKKVTREAVLKAAAEIGYAPNPGARMIRSGRMFRWGFLVPHLMNPEYAQQIEHLHTESRRRGCMLVLGLSHYDAELEAALIRLWAGGETDGLIIGVESWEQNGLLYQQLADRGYPLVFQYYAKKNFSCVGVRTYPSFVLAMQTYIGLGHRRIGFVGIEHPTTPESNRFTHGYIAYRDALQSHGVPLQEELVYFTENSRIGGIQAWKHFRNLKHPPTAILAYNDILAVGVWMSVHQEGLRVPQDISIVGCDDIPESEALGLSSIRYDRCEMARMLIDRLDLSLEKPDTSAVRHEVATSLIFRSSVAPPRAA